jgi:hypothetical protein
MLSLREKLTSSGGISSWQCFVGVPGTVQAIQLKQTFFLDQSKYLITGVIPCLGPANQLEPKQHLSVAPLFIKIIGSNSHKVKYLD